MSSVLKEISSLDDYILSLVAKFARFSMRISRRSVIISTILGILVSFSQVWSEADPDLDATGRPKATIQHVQVASIN